MNELACLLLAGAGGVILGLIFFGGLWWTVHYRLASPHAALWFLGSLLMRAGIVIAGFYFISQRDWRNILACLLGFLIGKMGVVILTRQKGGAPCA